MQLDRSGLVQQPREIVPHEPILDLGSLPAESLHKYLLYNGIIPHEPLTHEHAVRPLPPTLHVERPQKRLRIDTDPSAPEMEQELQPPASEVIGGPPPLGNEPKQADRRLVAQAIAHWNQTPTVKEGEAIAGFMLAVRKRRIRDQIVA